MSEVHRQPRRSQLADLRPRSRSVRRMARSSVASRQAAHRLQSAPRILDEERGGRQFLDDLSRPGDGAWADLWAPAERWQKCQTKQGNMAVALSASVVKSPRRGGFLRF